MKSSFKYSTPCIRCGKERIDKKSWKEKVASFIGSTTLTHTQTVCPDPKCQEIVERDFETQKKRREEIKLARTNKKGNFLEIRQSAAKTVLK